MIFDDIGVDCILDCIWLLCIVVDGGKSSEIGVAVVSTVCGVLPSDNRQVVCWIGMFRTVTAWVSPLSETASLLPAVISSFSISLGLSLSIAPRVLSNNTRPFAITARLLSDLVWWTSLLRYLLIILSGRV